MHGSFLSASVAALLLAAPWVAQAEGLTYDMRLEMVDEEKKAPDKIVMAGRGQSMAGNSRFEFTHSPGKGTLMGEGTYVIIKAGSPKQYIVNPAAREYSELDSEELVKAQSQQGVKMETSDIQFDTQSLGAGENIQGYSTVKYRITQAYTTTMTMMGKAHRSTQRSTTDMWIAPKLAGLFDLATDQMRRAMSFDKVLADRMAAAYAKLPKGMPLKSVIRNESGEGNDKTVSVMKSEIFNIKPGAISLAVFEIPAGYKRTNMLEGMKGVGGGSPKPAPNPPAADKKDNTDSNPVGDVVGAAKDGAKEGANEEAKSQAKDEAKKVLRGLFGK